ncbi:MAG: hypothetical protein MJZ76_09005 [Bacteroidales bacterium]|nr:hypothetical protein [Bacteroidales bacterium]
MPTFLATDNTGHTYEKPSNRGISSTEAIDFVTMIGGETALIEVKATTGNTKSSDTVLKNPQYEVDVCNKLSENNVGIAGQKITLPYYMAMFLK